MALCKERRKVLETCGHTVPLVCINALCRFSLGDVADIDLCALVEQAPHIPLKLNLKCFAAAFHAMSRTVEQQRRYMATQVDPFHVTAEDTRWLKESKSDATILLFRRGEVVVAGAKDEDSAKLAAHQFCDMLNTHTDLCVEMCDFWTRNQVVRFDVPFGVDLAGLKAMPEISNHIIYDPDCFPLATFRCEAGQQPPPAGVCDDPDDEVPDSRRAALISASGPVIVTGACNLRDALRYMRRIFPFLLLQRVDGAAVSVRQRAGARMDTDDVADVITGVVWRTTYNEDSCYADQSDVIPLGRDAHSRSRALVTLENAATKARDEDEMEVMTLLKHVLHESWQTTEPPKKRRKVRALQ